MNTPDERIEKYRNVTNLKERFGKRYRVQDDGTNDSERIERIWCMEIPHKTGTIYPYGFDGSLAVWTRSRIMMRKLEALGLRVLQGHACALERCFHLPLHQFEEVAILMGARKRRQMTPEQTAKATECFKAYRLSHGKTNYKPVSPKQEGPSRP